MKKQRPFYSSIDGRTGIFNRHSIVSNSCRPNEIFDLETIGSRRDIFESRLMQISNLSQSEKNSMPMIEPLDIDYILIDTAKKRDRTKKHLDFIIGFFNLFLMSAVFIFLLRYINHTDEEFFTKLSIENQDCQENSFSFESIMFKISTGVFKTEEQAKIQAKVLESTGFPSSIVQKENRYEVIVDAGTCLEQAVKTLSILQKTVAKNSFITIPIDKKTLF